MAWDFRPGMRVVCVDAGPIPGFYGVGPAGLIAGQVYTIRWVGDFPFGSGLCVGVRLREYVRQPDDMPVGSWRFRPLNESRLDVFRAYLAPAPRVSEPA